MAAATDPTVAVVFARQDDATADALVEALQADGAQVVTRRLMGLPGKVFADELDPEVRDAEAVVVVMSPWLQASDWSFSQEAFSIRERRDALHIWMVEPTQFGGGPMADAGLLAGPDDSAESVAARVKAGLEGDWEEATRDGPLDVPIYPDPSSALLAERLEGLHALKATTKGVRGLNAAIKRTAQALRTGPQLVVGEMLGNGLYRLLQNIGHGPLASVWKARDRESDAVVAVKVLHAQYTTNDAVLQQFFEMARAVSDLDHPSIAAIVDPGGTDQGFPYYVRRYLPGGSLQDGVASGSIDTAKALQTVLDVGRALELVHAEGMRHGNVKPDNVLYDVDGTAVLADFAARESRAVEGADTLFSAPEAQDPNGEVGPPADVYSLAMVTLFALHGAALPFWVLRDPERLIAGLEVGEAVKDALRAALDWDPEARTGTIAHFLEAVMSDAALVRMLGEEAARSGRHRVAADHLRELLARSDERPPALLLNLGRTLLSAGADEEARSVLREVLLSDAEPEVVDEAVAALEGLTERTGDWDAFADVLRERAFRHADALGGPTRADVGLLVRAARIRTAELEDASAVDASWREVLAHHASREQAAEALQILVDRASARQDWAVFVQFGREAWGFVPEPEKAELAYQIGVACMDALDDTQGGLLWLQRAADAGHEAGDLAERLERIRSARGEWRQVVALMLERAEAIEDEAAAVELLMRAAQVALYAHNHHEDAAAILLRVLLRDPEHREALRFLARHHARAGRDERALALYGRLAPHEERGRENEPVEVRVADNVDYATVLLRNDRPRGAQLCLEAALDLNPSHLPTLRLASQLSYDLGKWEEARVAFKGLVRAHESATNESALVQARCRLGDLAWLEGDAEGAAEEYNRALELDPECAAAWWGKAKTAITGNLGRFDADLVADRPWLVAAPVRMTPHEALARLLAAVTESASLRAWMLLDPMGPEVLTLLDEGPWQTDATPRLAMAAAAVDLMLARQLLRPELFRRLAKAFPAWSDAVESVRRLWFDGPVEHAFPVARCYRWSADVEGVPDFDPTHHRDVMPLAPPLRTDAPVTVRPSLASLHHSSAWKRLVQRDTPVAEPFHTAADDAVEAPEKSRSSVLVLHPGTPIQRVVRIDGSLTVGSDPDDGIFLDLAGIEPGHLAFERIGSRFYLTASGPLHAVIPPDLPPPVGLRVRGGERFEVGGVPAELVVYDTDDPPAIATEVAVSRPSVEPKPVDDADLSFEIEDPDDRSARAAIFYTKHGSEHIVPIVGDAFALWEEDGVLQTSSRPEEVGHPLEVQILFENGEWRVVERDDSLSRIDAEQPPAIEERPLRHGEEFVVGTHLLQFRLLHRANERPAIEDIAALWGAPEGAPILIYDDGTRHGRPIALTVDEFTIGRGRQTDFQISVDASLSRVHCRLERRGDTIFVSDAGSSNGTLLNGQPLLEPTALQDGDVILIGQSRMEFRTGDGIPSMPSMISLHEFGTEEPTEVLPVGEMSKKALPLDEGLDKIRVANKVLGIVIEALDEAEGAGRGLAELRLMLEARPRTYQQLLDGVEVDENALPGLEVMYNVAQRPDQEQRPLLNFVLGDLIDRAVEQACELLPDDRVDGVLSRVAETRYREFLRF
jgi:tetratricopeptide (TPR) repeat protein